MTKATPTAGALALGVCAGPGPLCATEPPSVTAEILRVGHMDMQLSCKELQLEKRGLRGQVLPRRSRGPARYLIGERSWRSVGVSVLVVSADGAVLLVRPVGEEYPVLPGVRVEPGEQLAEAAARVLRELVGLGGAPTHSLGLGWVEESVKDAHYVCDGGTVASEAVFTHPVPAGARDAVDRIVWVPSESLGHEVHPAAVAHLRVVLDARERGYRRPLPLLSVVEPAGAVPLGAGR
ncbi:NUDIX hydrolase [Kitasatospora sp. NA04385]|uniref:NUDIX hydrolase n=1 Tax=Kitasatospora sp. NA04385 TaxID=2742135 RepID=UPI001591A606|nr:NUDIX domain-containing protein [Kitasatospora sp. NA04385]QKW20975.1 NUDIX hydrolase [Kitasatospora sp. NA04385]